MTVQSLGLADLGEAIVGGILCCGAAGYPALNMKQHL